MPMQTARLTHVHPCLYYVRTAHSRPAGAQHLIGYMSARSLLSVFFLYDIITNVFSLVDVVERPSL